MIWSNCFNNAKDVYKVHTIGKIMNHQKHSYEYCIFPTLNINTYNYIIEIYVMNLCNVLYDEKLLFPISIGAKL
jgi:hypothetical protein